MRNIYKSTKSMEKRAENCFSLTEDILMENAAAALEKEVLRELKKGIEKYHVLIVTGSGGNGGDGMALARRLKGKIPVSVLQAFPPASEACIRQKKRAEQAGVGFTGSIVPCGIIVDCIFGSGFHGKLEKNTEELISALNSMKCRRISCDIPSGIESDGKTAEVTFKAHTTVSMGALKTALYSDAAKERTGKIRCGDLGISRELFEEGAVPDAFLLEKKDLILPERKKKNVHKGDFGHAAVVCGEKPGAAVIAASAAFAFGAGLVTITGNKPDISSPELLYSEDIPSGINAAAVGMGLGSGCEKTISWLENHPSLPCVLDADMFSCPETGDLLKKRKNFVLTPHPKEFKNLLKLCGMGEYSTAEIAGSRLALAREFCRIYDGDVLVLKGANSIIGSGNKIYINTLGKNSLAKGGSGDVLAGLICSLLAQGKSMLEAAIYGSMAHAEASRKIKNSYSMTPFDLIDKIKKLKNPKLINQDHFLSYADDHQTKETTNNFKTYENDF